MSPSTPSTSLPLTVSSPARYGAPRPSPSVAATSMPHPSLGGSGSGSIIVPLVGIILGVALLAVAGVLMGAYLWSLLKNR